MKINERRIYTRFTSTTININHIKIIGTYVYENSRKINDELLYRNNTQNMLFICDTTQQFTRVFTLGILILALPAKTSILSNCSV